MTQSGLLLVGHGTRSAAGTRCVERLRELVADRLPDRTVRHCFLELNELSTARGVAELVALGSRRIVVSPLLLFSAGHAKSDIPREVAAAMPADAEVHQAAALGCHPAIVELSQRRYEEATIPLTAVNALKTCLLLVGRGSYDAEAIAEMHRFASLRRDRMKGEQVEVAFIAMATPKVSDALHELAQQGWERVVVQPHLLFPGELLDNLTQLVAELRRQRPQTEWVLTAPLAADLGDGGPANRLLVDAVVGRVAEVEAS